jgi:hypothetical protein
MSLIITHAKKVLWSKRGKYMVRRSFSFPDSDFVGNLGTERLILNVSEYGNTADLYYS